MARTTIVLAAAALALFCLAGVASAQPAKDGAIRQLFLWSLKGGIPAGKTGAATRAALYKEWNAKNPKALVTGYWVGAQDDALLFQAKKDATWADLGGYTDWANAASYKTFKAWEADQASYKAIPVVTRTRLVANL